jgi:3'-phosphoadenosine 5'-phosphosulfate sulfotransferase (PAPS reductase)/FAD synthetase
MNHIVALSGGKDSTAMALRLLEVEPRDYEWIITPTGNEPPEMIEHWLKLGRLLGKPLRPVSNGKSLGGLIRLQNALPNWRMRWCTRMLKIEPFQQYIWVHAPCVVYVGIRADETDREGVDYDNLFIRRDYPLQRWNWELGDVLRYLECHDVQIPERTDCMACFFQTLYEWWVLWRTKPEAYAEAEQWEHMTGHTLRSEQRDSHPAALKDLRQEFESGYVPVRRVMKDRSAMCSWCAR